MFALWNFLFVAFRDLQGLGFVLYVFFFNNPLFYFAGDLGLDVDFVFVYWKLYLP